MLKYNLEEALTDTPRLSTDRIEASPNRVPVMLLETYGGKVSALEYTNRYIVELGLTKGIRCFTHEAFMIIIKSTQQEQARAIRMPFLARAQRQPLQQKEYFSNQKQKKQDREDRKMARFKKELRIRKISSNPPLQIRRVETRSGPDIKHQGTEPLFESTFLHVQDADTLPESTVSTENQTNEPFQHHFQSVYALTEDPPIVASQNGDTPRRSSSLHIKSFTHSR